MITRWWKAAANAVRALRSAPSAARVSLEEISHQIHAAGPLAIDDQIRAEPELARLYALAGYDLRRLDEARRALRRLGSMLRATIPDAAALLPLLIESRTRLSQEGLPPDAFLEEAIATCQTGGDLPALLNRNPVRDQLPYLERVPIRQGALVVWRSPLTVAVPPKRPADAVAFALELDALQRLIRSRQVQPFDPHPFDTQPFDAVRRALGTPNGYLPAPLLRLGAAVERALAPAADPLHRNRRDLLDRWVLEWTVLTRFGPHDGAAARANQLARQILENRWLQWRWTIERTLLLLLPQEWPAAPDAEARALLASVRADLESGGFDSAETLRRLRTLEGRGAAVSSLAFALVRAHGGPYAPPQQSTLVPAVRS